MRKDSLRRMAGGDLRLGTVAIYMPTLWIKKCHATSK